MAVYIVVCVHIHLYKPMNIECIWWKRVKFHYWHFTLANSKSFYWTGLVQYILLHLGSYREQGAHYDEFLAWRSKGSICLNRDTYRKVSIAFILCAIFFLWPSIPFGQGKNFFQRYGIAFSFFYFSKYHDFVLSNHVACSSFTVIPFLILQMPTTTIQPFAIFAFTYQKVCKLML